MQFTRNQYRNANAPLNTSQYFTILDYLFLKNYFCVSEGGTRRVSEVKFNLFASFWAGLLEGKNYL
jgi:hypothetical protein